MFREALHEVYIPRIQRGDTFYAAKILGAREALLSVLAHFFEQGRWEFIFILTTNPFLALCFKVFGIVIGKSGGKYQLGLGRSTVPGSDGFHPLGLVWEFGKREFPVKLERCRESSA
jgi:hypothetical protein